MDKFDICLVFMEEIVFLVVKIVESWHFHI